MSPNFGSTEPRSGGCKHERREKFFGITSPGIPAPEKRVILSMGGKGGVGKTCVMTGLAEWFQENSIPVKLLDLDTENKSRGSLTHFFGGQVPKVNIHTPAGLDAFVDELADGPPVILADMGAGAGQVTYDWFDKMYPSVAEAGITFTSVGVITADPASVESVLAWASRLRDRTAYLIVENSITEHTDFRYWRETHQALLFQQTYSPALYAWTSGCPCSKTPQGITALRWASSPPDLPRHLSCANRRS